MVKSHTPELAEKCPGGTVWGTAHPEVLPDPDIRVKDAERVEDGERERKGSLDPEDGKGMEPEDERRTETEERKGAEPKEKDREESEERRGNPATLGSLEGNLETPTETDGRQDRCSHVPGGSHLKCPLPAQRAAEEFGIRGDPEKSNSADRERREVVEQTGHRGAPNGRLSRLTCSEYGTAGSELGMSGGLGGERG
ncbi:hypothetical protein NDU88_007319 [Pleurodeles waltl]|uniref:Uncharacterized protein n=1 Tax=Pleurodeles waltl TaxID=8319 RepID=A0AAV7QKA9_PLEWA|nr:hypothetical protein NDU88_007319 [Pleurodeles waltl]